ncbi:MAG: GDSL-type esterase/lipase family protein [Bacteroidales bacterium]|nr:GDSL-type esterase/lipase family protein [Bacteroidales bacterium]
MKISPRFLSLIMIIFLAAGNVFAAKKKNINIVYIGNSISQGVIIKNPELNAPPVKCSKWLNENIPGRIIKFSNQGVSGLTTLNFLPEEETYFNNVTFAADTLKKADDKALMLFSIMIGTNDSAISGCYGSPVNPVQYITNLKVIIETLAKKYPDAVFVINRAIWYSPNTYNGSMYLKSGLDRLNSYFPRIQKMIEDYSRTMPNRVFLGDTEAYEFFKENHTSYLIPENGNAGVFYLHPNIEGAEKLGIYWGNAIKKVIESNF